MTEFKTQEEFIREVNHLILEGKKQGYSTDKISDKWHTFEDLYFHRMVLFYAIMKKYPDKSWKARQHYDGSMFDKSFIVGIETPIGQYTYHYDIQYWDFFDIKEFERAPKYDGHKPEDISRILTLLNIKKHIEVEK